MGEHKLIAGLSGVDIFTLSPDGQYVPVGYSDHTVQVDTMGTFTTVAEFDAGGDIDRLEFSADGQRLLVRTGGSDEGIEVWDISGGVRLFRWDGYGSPRLSPDGASINIVTYSRDGNRLTKFDVMTGGIVEERAAEVYDYPWEFSPDGRYVANTHNSTIWDATTGEPVMTYRCENVDVVWSPDSTRLAVASAHLIRIWRVPERVN
jgi:WD40 repeat protein